MAKTPEINFDALNRELDGVIQRANINGLPPKAQEAARQFSALKQSKLSTEMNKIISGFKSLTQELDDAEGLEEIDKVATQGVALLSGNASGLKNIVKQNPSSNSDLETLTGNSVGGGLLNFKVTSPTPESLSRALQELTGEPLDKVSTAVQGVSTQNQTDLKNSLNTVVGKGQNVGTEFLGEVNKFVSSLEAEINNIGNGYTGQLKNLAEEFNGQLGPTLNKITGGRQLSSNVKGEVAVFLEQNKTAEAAQLLQRYSTLSLTQIETLLDTVPVTMVEKVAVNKPLSAKTTSSTII